MPADLILVRHAAPAIDPQTPPVRWRLSAEGRHAAEALAHRLPRPAAVVASSEAKAIETAELLAASFGLRIELDAGFDEHRRDGWAFGQREAQAARVLRVLRTPQTSIEGSETGKAARLRFEAALSRRRERPLLVVSHGTIMSLWLAERLALDAGDLWRSLGLPDAFVLDAAGRLIERISR